MRRLASCIASLFSCAVLLLICLPRLPALAASPQVFCWEVTPQSQAVLAGLERVLQQSLPVSSAEGDPVKAEQLSRQLAQERYPVLIVLGTPALRAVAPRHKRFPVVFAMVADPFQTGAAYDPARPEDHQENTSGLASPPPLAEALHQAQTLFPGRQHWGMIYNPYEGVSVELSQILARLAREAGLTLTLRAATSAASAAAALQDLLQEGVQVFFLPPDGFAKTYAPTLLGWGRERRVLVVNGNPRQRAPGAVLSVTLDYEAVGEEVGRLVQRVLAGEKLKTIPIRQFSPARVEVDEALLQRWAGYPPAQREEGKSKKDK